MNAPENLQYTRTHEWVETLDNGNLRMGLTDYAQHHLDEIVYVELPEPGDRVECGESFAEAESVKAVSEVISGATGDIVAVNGELADHPGLVNEAPYAAWLVEVSGEICDGLLDAAEYEKFCAEQG